MSNHYHHLTRDQRCQIYAFNTIGLSKRQIAYKLGVSPSTIGREMKRNQGERGYRFQQADKLASRRRRLTSSQPRCMTEDNLKVIEVKLQEGWSPDQISGRLCLEQIYISHETIYRHIWADKKQGGGLYTHLRHGGKKYNRRSSGKAGRGCIPNRVDIKERPATVEEKSRVGDWEGDTIVGANHQGAILTLVDRKSKYTIMEKLEAKTAREVLAASKKRLKKLRHKVRTMTFDNGKEFSMHEQITKALKAKCYFATPYHSWERGLNEHTNGLIRQYIPKSSDLTKLSKNEVQWIENCLNSRPRKVLEYKTPEEVFYNRSTSRVGVALQR